MFGSNTCFFPNMTTCLESLKNEEIDQKETHYQDLELKRFRFRLTRQHVWQVFSPNKNLPTG